MPSKFIENPPPWVVKAINKNHDRIKRKFGKKHMPTDLDESELGTGHYGTVFSTSDKGVVMKITSDPSEAEFIKWLLKRPKSVWDGDEGELIGMVRYYKIVELEYAHRGRSVYAITREAAIVVGYSDTWAYLKENARGWSYIRAELNEMEEHLVDYKIWASVVRDLVKKRKLTNKELLDALKDGQYYQPDWEYDFLHEKRTWWDTPKWSRIGRTSSKEKAVMAMYKLWYDAEIMANTYLTQLMGKTLYYLLEEGVILADIHLGNIGIVPRQPMLPVITDPGHMVSTK